MAARRAWMSPAWCLPIEAYGVRIPLEVDRVVPAAGSEFAMLDVRLPDRCILHHLMLWQYGALSSFGGGARVALSDWLPTSAAEMAACEQILAPAWLAGEGGGYWRCMATGGGGVDVRVPFDPQGRRIVVELYNGHTAGVWMGIRLVVSSGMVGT